MKYIYYIFWLLTFFIVLIGCSANAPQEPMNDFPDTIDMVPDNTDVGIGDPIIQEDFSIVSDAGSPLIINNFTNMAALSSHVTITGQAPRKWFFEWMFPVTLMTPNGDVIVTAGATWNWLDSVNGNPNLEGDDMIEFITTLEFSTPLGATEGKIQFRADNPSGESENDDMVEVQILFQ